MHCEVDYARALFEGLPLIGKVNRDLAIDLDLFSRGGLEILRAIEAAWLRRAERAAGDLQGQKNGADAARRQRQDAALFCASATRR